MTTHTKMQIVDFIKKNRQSTPHELAVYLKISAQAVHRQLKSLVAEKTLSKVGSPPHVYYVFAQVEVPATNLNLSQKEEVFLTENYLYITPQGQIKYGLAGFVDWAKTTKQSHLLRALILEYIKIRSQFNEYFEKDLNLIPALEKFNSTFNQHYLENIYYSDFYSLPQFGKTKLGFLILYAKQAQDKHLMGLIAKDCQKSIEKLIKKNRIEAIVWTPHSLPRKIPLLTQLKKDLSLTLPVITFLKAYSGEIPIPQKSLSKLEERIENAENTIFPKENIISFKRVLIIDDAVGSGATIQAIAGKIKHINPKIKVFAYAFVGSLKGFEIIKEV